MSLKLIVTKLHFSKKKFILADELKEYCKTLKAEYNMVIRYLTYHKYLLRVFRGIFYINSLEERKFGKTDLNYQEIIGKALALKGIKRWYFGLETALKLNNLTHEYFTIDSVVSDSLFRAKPISLLGHKVRFVKISPRMMSFGIKRKRIPYSDPEKTILDLLYLNRIGSSEFFEYSANLSRDKIKKYFKYYNRRVAQLVNGLK